LGVGAAAGDDLRAPLGEQVDRGELLPDPYRVLRAEHGNRTGQPDPAGAFGSGCQQDLRGGADEVAAVVLPDSEQVQADLIGQLRLFDRLPHPLLWRGGLAGGQVLGDLTEGHDADLESHMHSSSLGRPGPEPRGSTPRGSTPRGSTPRTRFAGGHRQQLICADNYSLVGEPFTMPVWRTTVCAIWSSRPGQVSCSPTTGCGASSRPGWHR